MAIILFRLLFGLLFFSIASTSGWICLGTTGSIDGAVAQSNNRSCDQLNVQVSGVLYNVSWSSGSYSLILVDLTINAQIGSLATLASGSVISGKYKNQMITLGFSFLDLNNQCLSANGISQLTGTAFIDIPGFLILPAINCHGNATLDFAPPLTSVQAAITSTLFVDFSSCIGYNGCP